MPRYLTDDHVREFYTNGFFLLRSVFSAAEVAEMAVAFDDLERQASQLRGMVMHNGAQFVLRDDESVDLPTTPATSVNSRTAVTSRPGTHAADGRPRIRRVVWCGAASPVLNRYGEDPRLLAIARDILGSDAGDHLIHQAHFKLPHDGIFFPWHQDSTHRGYGTAAWTDVNGRGSYIQMAVAIDRATHENGPLKFIPGSCVDGHLGLLYSEDRQTPLPKFDPATAVEGLMEPGDLVAFGPYTIHGSDPNVSDASRRVFINGFACPGANSRKYPGHDAGAGRRVVFPAL